MHLSPRSLWTCDRVTEPRQGMTLELPPCGCMPPSTSQVAVYIHVCSDAVKTLKEINQRL